MAKEKHGTEVCKCFGMWQEIVRNGAEEGAYIMKNTVNEFCSIEFGSKTNNFRQQTRVQVNYGSYLEVALELGEYLENSSKDLIYKDKHSTDSNLQ